MRENQDCETCCGDCPKGNCLQKTKRVCGGNKDGRGCGTHHVGHELWCSNAKLCFTVAEQPVFRTVEEGDEGVLLQVMKIPSVDSSAPYETTLWDTACSGLFVRNAHAREKGFTSRHKRLKVVTLGGEIKEMDTVIFDCKIKDLRGNFYEFQAHGLDEVTGALDTDLGKELMERLFPGIIGGFKMCGASVVD